MSLTRDEASDLLRRCISNTKSLRTIIDEDHMKKLNMKSIADLRKALDNIVAELEFRADGILDSMMSAKDPMIAFNNLHALMASVHSLHAISDRINNSLVVVHVRKAYYDGKVRTKLSTLNENYIHLLTTLSWDNVKKTEVIEAPPAPLAVCNHYEEGYKHFYGIGRPRNFSLALDRFRDAMNVDNHPDAIIYVSDYYLLCLGGIGVDIGSKEDKQQTFYLSTRNRISKVFELLEHAHELGSQEAKYRLASLILIRECSPELLYNTNEGNANTIETKKYQSTFYSHSLLREILEKIYEDTSGDNDCLESNMNTFGNGQDGNGFFSPACSSRAEPNATSEVDNKLGQTQSVGQSCDFSKLHLFSSVTSLKSSMRKPLTTENAMIASLNKTVSKQQSIDRALQLYAEASEGGHAASQRQYGLICELLGNYHEAVQYYKYASENGDGDAYNCLALLYHHGASSSIDYDADHTEHVSVDMGTSLRNNVYTIHQDYNMAFALFANAANAGCSCAYNNIGLYYEKQLIASSKENHKEINHYGMTIRNHLLDALYYYSMGAKAGSVMSMYNYGYLLIQIYTKYMSIHTEIDTNSNQYTDMMSDGLHWLRCAADYGNLDANFQLGVIYESVSAIFCVQLLPIYM